VIIALLALTIDVQAFDGLAEQAAYLNDSLIS